MTVHISILTAAILLLVLLKASSHSDNPRSTKSKKLYREDVTVYIPTEEFLEEVIQVLKSLEERRVAFMFFLKGETYLSYYEGKWQSHPFKMKVHKEVTLEIIKQ